MSQANTYFLCHGSSCNIYLLFEYHVLLYTNDKACIRKYIEMKIRHHWRFIRHCPTNLTTMFALHHKDIFDYGGRVVELAKFI